MYVYNKKIIGIIIGVLLFPIISNASILSELRVHNLNEVEFSKKCPTTNMACTYGGDIFINLNTKKVNLYEYAFFHEVGHNLFTPYMREYREYDEEELCDYFSLWIITGIDLGDGLFQKMIINGLK